MLSTIAATALLGVTVSAAPWGSSGGSGSGWGSHQWGHQPAAPTASSSDQGVFKYPLSNGFPNIDNPSSELTAIEQQAHGTLGNGGLPTSIEDATETTFEVIAFNELFEVAFFTSLLMNITDNVAGYEIDNAEARNLVLTALTAIQGQEQLHALGANGILKSAGKTPIQPCEYTFPVDNFFDAIALASTFTDVVLGTLQSALTTFGTDGDAEFLQLVGSIIGQEGEQNGFYRVIGDKNPSALPFLTTSAGPFAFSALNQNFVVPGSCPNSDIIEVPVFGLLSVDTQNIQPVTQPLQFSFTNINNTDTSSLSIVYINQQNVPVVEKVENVKVSGDVVTFTANFPFDQFEMNGLTISAVTDNAGPFANATAVAESTLFGPGLIEIN